MTSAVSSSSFSARSGATVRAELRKTRSYGLVRTATAFLAIIPFVAIAVWQYASGSGSAAGAATAAATTQLRLLSSNASSNGTLVPGEHCRIPLVADPAQITHPAGSILYLIGVAFAFVGISIVCEEHFAKALEEIIDKMDMSADLAAVLILAPGSSAPEFVAGMLSMFVADTNSVGTGTILGSAVFNQLIIVGGSILLAKEQTVVLSTYSLLRDIAFYAITLTILVAVFVDGNVYAWEASFFLILYLIYVVVAIYLPNYVPPEWLESGDTQGADADDISLTVEGGEGEGDDDAASGKGVLYVVKEYLELPFRLACAYTIPDLSVGARSANPLWILGSVLASLLWLCIYVFFMIEWVERVGCQLGISAGVMGLTLSAVGTSVPDAYMSFLVAKAGHPGMAVSNAFASNMFDILFALGVPFCLWELAYGKIVLVDTKDLTAAAIILFGIMFVFVVNILATKKTLGPAAGYSYIVLYALFLLWVFLNNANVFGNNASA